ncbi:PREDICTED: reverse mRNAase [Prunus dulcis]|uniref:PREDICTED: reverse mRNAase n=1 Tax=Prunus dulcis TaxID=3755 RepID=A0A5E4GI22_PRUDU|nr:hypothetical protein L3X38_000061 [Prunus dulcis]VVA39350.1 PREDICTED: reverse mRNAase [Prunus dulcis]
MKVQHSLEDGNEIDLNVAAENTLEPTGLGMLGRGGDEGAGAETTERICPTQNSDPFNLGPLIERTNGGIGGVLTVPNLVELTRLHSPDLVILLETKNKGRKLEFLKRRLDMPYMCAVDAHGFRGGLCAFWKDPQLVVLSKYSDCLIELLIHGVKKGDLWRLMAIYASVDAKTHAQQ